MLCSFQAQIYFVLLLISLLIQIDDFDNKLLNASDWPSCSLREITLFVNAASYKPSYVELSARGSGLWWSKKYFDDGKIRSNETNFLSTTQYCYLVLKFAYTNNLTKMGPWSWGTFIDKRSWTKVTPTKDFPVPGGPCEHCMTMSIISV